ncbi:hypothetical protein N748_04760 [Legionella pneumophila str. 121004]|nr:hypothetical protein N748_04760 [Legionella pneumophila str. 121004]ERH45191.1 hypothetical protein N751_00835 [Legionella pneumophila str. Leg01/11]ERI48898.1 hypothetical protein N749_07800 [Legionella pneumophila str. Leg01/20]
MRELCFDCIASLRFKIAPLKHDKAAPIGKVISLLIDIYELYGMEKNI